MEAVIELKYLARVINKLPPKQRKNIVNNLKIWFPELLFAFNPGGRIQIDAFLVEPALVRRFVEEG